MSGICGIYYLDGRPVNPVELTTMVDILVHRGPDGADMWHDGPVGLGHRMLWTTPESLNEKLPYERNGLVITADARIDNRDELIPVLGLTNRPAREITDSQLILAAYEKWGEQCPEKLLGDFAFAIWNKQEEQLFCGRDHFGVKPLYYHRSSSLFIFASEIKALLCLDEVPRQLNEKRIAKYLTSTFDDPTITFYQDVFRLSPAHFLKVRLDGMQLRRYWSLNPSQALPPEQDGRYASCFREIFSDAVRCRLRSNGPVGSMLSGGLDSSSITCLAQRLMAQGGDQSLQTFSAVFDGVPASDESQFINAVLAKPGLKAHFMRGDQRGPFSDLDRILWHQDEPLYAFNLSLNWGLYDIAKIQGIRIILDGFDGDTTVSHGTGHFFELAHTKQWFTLLSEIKGYAKNFDCSPRNLLWDLIWLYEVNPRIRKYSFLRMGQRMWKALRRRVWSNRSNYNGGQKDSILNPDFAQRIDLDRRKVRQALPLAEREHHFRNLTRSVIPYTLEVLDKAAAAFSIELRYPFWDKRLVEFCLALPPEQKIHKGWTRMVLRQAMTGILPEEIRWRGGKSNMGHNFCHTLFTYERSRLNQVIVENPQLAQPYVNIDTLQKTYQEFVAQELLTEERAMLIWKAVSLALWLKFKESTPQ